MERRQTLQQTVLGKQDSDTQKNATGYLLTPYTKINSKWLKDLNVRQESIEILEENTGSSLFNLSCSNFLLDTLPEARETKAKKELLGFHQNKNFCTEKETINKTKRQPTEWEKIFATTYWIRVSIQNL